MQKLMTCILLFVFGDGFGYPKRIHSLNIGMFLRFISLKHSSQFRITFQKSLTFEHLRKRFTMSSTSLQYSHISESFIVILYNHLLHGITLCRTLYWKVWIFVFLRTTNGSLKILCHVFSLALSKSWNTSYHLLMLFGLCFLFQLGANRSLHMLFCLVPFLCLLNGLCLHLQMIYLYISWQIFVITLSMLLTSSLKSVYQCLSLEITNTTMIDSMFLL